MTFLNLLRLTAINLRRDFKSALLTCAGTAVGIGALAFFIALGSGLGGIIREQIFPADVRAIEVVPSAVSFGSLLGGARLDDGAAGRLAAIPGVEKAFRKMEIRVPAMASPAQELADTFRVPGNIRVALIAVGVEDDYAAPGAVSPDAFRWSADTDPAADSTLKSLPIPAMASDRLLALYNQAFAASQGLPPVSRSLLESAAGVPLVDVQFGRSMAGGRRLDLHTARLSFAGLTPRAPLHGVIIPLAAARAVNRLYGQDAETYSAVTLLAADPSKVPDIRRAVRSMGFSISDSGRELADKVGQAVALVTAAMAFLSVLICLIAAVSIAHALLSSVRVREKEFALMRAIGASRSDIAGIILGEAAIIGLGGGAAGLTSAALAAAAVRHAFLRSPIPGLDMSTLSLFHFTPSLILLSLAVAVLSAVLGAIAPAAAASRADPARLLAG